MNPLLCLISASQVPTISLNSVFVQFSTSLALHWLCKYPNKEMNCNSVGGWFLRIVGATFLLDWNSFFIMFYFSKINLPEHSCIAYSFVWHRKPASVGELSLRFSQLLLENILSTIFENIHPASEMLKIFFIFEQIFFQFLFRKQYLYNFRKYIFNFLPWIGYI